MFPVPFKSKKTSFVAVKFLWQTVNNVGKDIFLDFCNLTTQ